MTPHQGRPARRLIIVAAALVSLVASLPARAEPADPPDDRSSAMQRYNALGAAAAKADEDLSEARTDLRTAQRRQAQARDVLVEATRAAKQARMQERRFQGKVDNFSVATLRGARLTKLSALLTSDSRREFLQQMSAIDVLATDNAETLSRLRTATDRTDTARERAAHSQREARQARTAAERAVRTVRGRAEDLQEQIGQVRRALAALSEEERTSLGTVQDTGSYAGPPGAANDALQAALGRRGSEYEWGATGPNEFDCSGLTSWAYEQAGVSIPRSSRDQYTVGKPVGIGQLVPGDLLFFDDGSGDPGAIHHVGMFAGEGKMVDAPTEGQLVDVRSISGDGHFIGARRIVG